MSYLQPIKDQELVNKQLNLLKDVNRLHLKFSSLWLENNEQIAPYNEKMIKSLQSDTLHEFLVDFKTIREKLKEQGMFLDLLKEYDKYTMKRDFNDFMDIGFFNSIKRFFTGIVDRILRLKGNANKTKIQIEGYLEAINQNTPLSEVLDKPVPSTFLWMGANGVTHQGENMLGVLPTITKQQLREDPDVKEKLEEAFQEYSILVDYASQLLESFKNLDTELPKDSLLNPSNRKQLNEKMREIVQQNRHLNFSDFSDLQRTLVAKFYLDNLSHGIVREEDKEAERRRFIQYEVLIYLLSKELSDIVPLPYIRHIALRGSANELKEDREKTDFNIYLKVEKDVLEDTLEKSYGILTYNQLRVLKIVLELHRNVANIIYHNPKLIGLYTRLQSKLATVFVELYPNRIERVGKPVINTTFPFKFKDGVIEGYLLQYGFDQPQSEVTIFELFEILAQRNTKLFDLDKSYNNLQHNISKLVEPDPDVEDDVYRTVSAEELERLYNDSYKERMQIKIL